MLSLLLCLTFTPIVLAFHCEHDVDLDTGQTELTFDIYTHPDDGMYWVSNMEFFLFGEFTEEPTDEVLSAGFYELDSNKLVYKVTVDCGAGTWQTEYQNDYNTTEDTVWKSGELRTPCQKGIFDFTYELQQDHRGKFLFNAEEMEHTLVTFGINCIGNSCTSERTRIAKLPTNLENGKVFSASISGSSGTFTRYAYGKCIAFPRSIQSNCTEVQEWLRYRSKSSDYGGEFGAWNTYNSVTCYSTIPEYFYWVQGSVHADENSQGLPYCCCTHMNGTMPDPWLCMKYADVCTMGCYAYIDYTKVDVQAEIDLGTVVENGLSGAILNQNRTVKLVEREEPLAVEVAVREIAELETRRAKRRVKRRVKRDLIV